MPPFAGSRTSVPSGMEADKLSPLQHNVHQVKEIYKMAQDLDAIALHIFMLVPVGCGVQISPRSNALVEKWEEILNWFYDISKEKRIHRVTCAPHYFRIMGQRAKEEGIHITPHRLTGWPQ